MDLPKNFNFSQRSLQDFIYCRRLFQYRYIEHIKWPAVALDPIDELENRAKLGAEFHRIVQQYFSGISEEKIENYLGENKLRKWWINFKNSIIKDLDNSDSYLPEVRLYSVIQNFRLIAKIDLIAVKSDGSRIIFDWKTSKKRPERKILSENFQTMVYPYLITSAGNRIYPWKKISPNKVKMIYWFAEFPENVEIFRFDSNKFNTAKEEIRNIIEKIERMKPGDFSKTDQISKCKFCVYRSLCGRGDLPGNDEEANEWFLQEETREFDLDIDQIAEIEF
jgi:CRISPR/Cas system-associated exonuclease Cas4 (RecB family)